MKLIQANRTNRDVDLDDGLDEHVDRRLAVSSRITSLWRSGRMFLFWRRVCGVVEVSVTDDRTDGLS
jgi:hypothetical protein